jgi:ADP-dependent NAD(P)H-hydrate dehydratase / NAD(P)H-hydrate epimerase
VLWWQIDEPKIMKILSAAEMREVDRLTSERYGIAGLTLMENAGRSVAEFLQQRFPNLASRRAIVLCGKGNNGGDGLVVARHLTGMGAKPIVILFADPGEIKGDAGANLKRWEHAKELRVARTSGEWQSTKKDLGSSEIVVDALLGTGVRGKVEGLLAEVIADVNRRGPDQCVVAVDIPSGLSADLGETGGPIVEADYTVTFTAPKTGMFLGNSADFLGQMVVRDIGSPGALIEETGKGKLRWSEAQEFKRFAARRHAEGHKGDYGHVLVVAGSVGKTGAAVLASWAALRSGAGLVTVGTAAPALPLVAAHRPEVMTHPLAATEAGTIALRDLENGQFESLLKGKKALGIGPGLSTDPETQDFVRSVVGMRAVATILDADGLNAFAGRAGELKNARGELCVTPHPGEMSRLVELATNEVQAKRVELAAKAAAKWNAQVVLKGYLTVVAAPDGSAYINSTGNPGMGTAGTGDVLTGMLSGLTAQYGTEAWPSMIAFGVYLHGLAGDIAWEDGGEAPLVASDLIERIPRAYQKFYSECGRG